MIDGLYIFKVCVWYSMVMLFMIYIDLFLYVRMVGYFNIKYLDEIKKMKWFYIILRFKYLRISCNVFFILVYFCILFIFIIFYVDFYCKNYDYEMKRII